VVDLQPGDLLYTPPGYVLKKTWCKMFRKLNSLCAVDIGFGMR
jgi:hypothetical protein